MRRKFFLPLLIVVMFVTLFVRYYQRGPSRNYSDFRVYHTTAVRFLGGEDIYGVSDPKITPFKYSPAFALLISPLGYLPIHEASLVFFTLNFCLFLAFIALSEKLLFKEKPPEGWGRFFLYALPVAAVFRFALLVLDSGQATLWMVVPALAGLCLIEKKKDLSGAALVAFSVMVKYVTFIFVPYLFFKKKWKAVLGILAGMAAYSFLPALFCGVSRAIQYLFEWMPFITKTSLDQGSWTDYKNQSVYSWVLRLLMTSSPYRGVQPSSGLFDFKGALLAGVLVVLLLYAWTLFSSTRAGKDPSMTYGALFVGLAIFNPNCWPFNFIMLLLPVMALTRHLMESRWRDRWTLIFLAAALILLNVGTKSFANKSLQYNSEVWSFMTIGGLLILVAAVRLNFLNARPARAISG